MKNYLSYCFSVMALVCFISSTPASAHEEHCHVKGKDGKVVDAADLKTQKACDEKGGSWRHHHSHCHKADGQHVDIKEIADEKACLAKGGKWNDHGHEKLAE